MSTQNIFKVIFVNQGKVYEIYARNIYQGEMYGFIEVENLLFGEKTSVVVDPSEEKLKTEFQNTVRSYIPMHAIIRIDEVEKQGNGKIIPLSAKDGNIMPFPSPIYTPSPGGDND